MTMLISCPLPVRQSLGPAGLLALVALVLPRGGAAETSRLTYRGLDVDGQSALTTLTEMTTTRFELDVSALVEGLGSANLAFLLLDASPASRRQAIAHALGCWWADTPAHGVILTHASHLPNGPLLVNSFTSTLIRYPAYEDLVRRLLLPWLGGDAGLSLLPDSGMWTATLDAAGQARLSEIISILERGTAQCASMLGDPDQPDLERVVTTPCHATTWTALIEGLATGCSCSVSVDRTTRSGPFPGAGVSIGLCHLAEVPALLRDAGLTARFLHGVLCISRRGLPPPCDRQHPGQRRLIALLTIPQLAASRVDGELIATSLKRLTGVADDWWSQPGADLVYLEPLHALLVSADLPTQMEVLAAVGLLDRLGVTEGLRQVQDQQLEPAPAHP
jgi:hypothetical protein